MANKSSHSDTNTPANTQPAQDATAKAVQSAVDQETKQGFRGVEVDPTPNEAYTVAGVTSGQPTPETDPALATKVGSAKFRDSAAQDEAR